MKKEIFVPIREEAPPKEVVMDKSDIKQIKKHKAHWIPFFCYAIVMAACSNIYNSVRLLAALKQPDSQGILASQTLHALGVNVLQSVLLVVSGLIIFVLKMPVAVRLWEYKEWGRRVTVYLAALSIIVAILFLVTPVANIFPKEGKIFLLLEGVVLNTMIILYFSRSKIKSIFVK